jgi:hypothetical protein
MSSFDFHAQAPSQSRSVRASTSDPDPVRLEAERARTMDKLAGASSVGVGTFGLGPEADSKESKKEKKVRAGFAPRRVVRSPE